MWCLLLLEMYLLTALQPVERMAALSFPAQIRRLRLQVAARLTDLDGACRAFGQNTLGTLARAASMPRVALVAQVAPGGQVKTRWVHGQGGQHAPGGPGGPAYINNQTQRQLLVNRCIAASTTLANRPNLYRR